MFIKNRKLRLQVVMFIIILSTTISKTAETVAKTHDYGHFRILHLVMVLACGMLLGGIITRLRYKNQLEESPKL